MGKRIEREGKKAGKTERSKAGREKGKMKGRGGMTGLPRHDFMGAWTVKYLP